MSSGTDVGPLTWTSIWGGRLRNSAYNDATEKTALDGPSRQRKPFTSYCAANSSASREGMVGNIGRRGSAQGAGNTHSLVFLSV